MILGFYAGKSHNLIGLGIFHGDLDFFDLHDNSLTLAIYEIFPHKILKSRTFEKSSILIVIMRIQIQFFTFNGNPVCQNNADPALDDTGTVVGN